MKEIAKAFLTEGRSVYDLFQQPGMGFYIPLYQREYSWDTDNVKQLIDDLSRGVDSLCSDEDEEIRFLGTLITVSEADRNKIQPQDTQALPTLIEVVIDGQQRLTTLVLLASQLYLHILDEEIKLKKYGEEFSELQEACVIWRSKLKEVFALDLRKGNPKIKPKIIRGQVDKWIKEGDISDAYTSPAAKYIGNFIQFITDTESDKVTFKLANAPSVGKDKVGASIRQFSKWLSNIVSKSHLDSNEGEFPSAKSILAKTNQEFIWEYDRDNLKQIIDDEDVQDSKTGQYHLCALVQLFAVSHYMLERCCFTVIRPVSDKWAFDMFQSLNATGTPLTAIETFKPLIVNTVENIEGKLFKNSEDDKWFSKVEELFSDTKTASEKNKLTSDFLTSFALVTDADNQKISSHFSAQRKWIDKTYSRYSEKANGGGDDPKARVARQHDFVKFFGQYAAFYKNIWMNYAGANGVPLPTLLGRPDAELASVILLYLNKSNHRMAITILAQYYMAIQNGPADKTEALTDDFIAAVKAVGSFYTLWKCAQSNSLLDARYRTFFKGTKGADGQLHNTVAWLQRTEEPTVAHLKQYLREALTNNEESNNKEIFTRETWLKKAKNHLDYTSPSAAKFVLLLYAHDTIADDEHLGLAKKGVPGVHNSLTVANWKSQDLETLEHVAPRKNDGSWDPAIYEGDIYNHIGNLILLPSNVNTSASNKGWPEKLVYYKHLGQIDPAILMKIAEDAIAKGIIISKSSIEIMQKAAHQPHINVLLGMDGVKEWDAKFIEQRTERILSITWDRLTQWLN